MPVANLCGIIKINYTNLELTQEFQRERKQTNKKQSALVKYIYGGSHKYQKPGGENSQEKNTEQKESIKLNYEKTQ